MKRAAFALILAIAACAPQKPATVGAPAPQFALPATEGKQVSLKALRGKRKAALIFFRSAG